MSLFGSFGLMGDVEDDPFFGSHMRHMRQMNNMMNSMFSNPFGMLGGEGPLAIMGPRQGNAMMPFMPQMPSLNRLFTGNMDAGNMSAGSSFSSSTVVMSSGPGGKPQVYSSTSSTKVGPHGIKETCKTMQDSRSGTKKMSIGHHIGERAHVIEREQNYYTGDAEEHQEYINLEEEEAEDFDREFQYKAGSATARAAPAIMPAPAFEPPRLAIAAPPGYDAPRHAPAPGYDAPRHANPAPPPAHHHAYAHAARSTRSEPPARRAPRPAARRALRTGAATHSPSVREVYGSSHPQRHRPRQHKQRHADNN